MPQELVGRSGWEGQLRPQAGCAGRGEAHRASQGAGKVWVWFVEGEVPAGAGSTAEVRTGPGLGCHCPASPSSSTPVSLLVQPTPRGLPDAQG